jgi:two-component system response regulator AtoC
VKSNILIIDDEDDILQYCLHSLSEHYIFHHVQNGKEGLKKLSEGGIASVLLDRSFFKSDPSELIGLKENAKNEGIAILKLIRMYHKILPVIMVTQYGDYDAAKEALASGATDFIEWGTLTSDKYFLKHYLDRAIDTINVQIKCLKQKYNAFGMVGSSEKMVEVIKAIEEYKDNMIPVLIQGESGTGKELVAHALHLMSKRNSKPFVPVDCGVLTENLAESELFGHKKGSFTNAFEDKKGLFEMADEGTLFLDEIGNLGPNIQSKLLRILETSEVRRIGETFNRKINVKIVTATNSELEKKYFRQDLYWRLDGAKIILPALKEHKEDIPELVHHFIAKYSLEYDRQIHNISSEALDYLKNENFQENNVRELEILIKRCVATANEIITLGDIVRCRDEAAYYITKYLNDAVCSWIGSGSNCPLMDKGTMDDLERAAILHRLEMYKGNKEEAAKSLGIGKSKFYQKLKEYKNIKE